MLGLVLERAGELAAGDAGAVDQDVGFRLLRAAPCGSGRRAGSGRTRAMAPTASSSSTGWIRPTVRGTPGTPNAVKIAA